MAPKEAAAGSKPLHSLSFSEKDAGDHLSAEEKEELDVVARMFASVQDEAACAKSDCSTPPRSVTQMLVETCVQHLLVSSLINTVASHAVDASSPHPYPSDSNISGR